VETAKEGLTTKAPDQILADELEASLRDLVSSFPQEAPARSRKAGRPPLVSHALLWLGFLVCVLRGFTAQRAVWRLLCFHGFWGHEPVPLVESAIYQRLARSAPAAFTQLFQQVTAALLARHAAVSSLQHLAPFAAAVYALDHCTLDPVVRKLKLLRDVPPGDDRLLPGRLAALFDVRRQLFHRVEFELDATRNVKLGVEHLLEGLPKDCLLLFDLGYFSFPWFDLLTHQGFFYISRLRDRTSWKEIAKLGEVVEFCAVQNAHVKLRESWVYLGAHRANRAAAAARLIEVVFPTVTYRYLTNVLDPQVLPAAQVVQLYARRWDIEQAFNLLKTQLKLYLLWSGHLTVVQLQVFATLLIAQVVLALRNDLAQRARADLREVSLPLMLASLARLAADGKDPLQELTLHGRRMKIIRPFRGTEYVVPAPSADAYTLPETWPPPRKPRYPEKDNGPGRTSRKSPSPRSRKRTSTWNTRSPRSPR
jgi:hypothetical protein